MVWVAVDALLAEVDGPLDPFPRLDHVTRIILDVVAHVPYLEAIGLDVGGLHLGNEPDDAFQLDMFALLLQLIGAVPQKRHEGGPEAPQHYSGAQLDQPLLGGHVGAVEQAGPRAVDLALQQRQHAVAGDQAGQGEDHDRQPVLRGSGHSNSLDLNNRNPNEKHTSMYSIA